MSKIILFSFLYYVIMIKRKIINLVTTFTTPRPWLREKPFFSFRHYVQYAIVTEKEIWFLLSHYFDYATIMKKLFFFISLGRSLWKYLFTWSFLAHYITNLLKKFPDGIVPGKSMCNLRNFFLRNFSGVLRDFLPLFKVWLILKILIK